MRSDQMYATFLQACECMSNSYNSSLISRELIFPTDEIDTPKLHFMLLGNELFMLAQHCLTFPGMSIFIPARRSMMVFATSAGK